MWTNFHTHCNYCDGKGELTDYVHQAKALNMRSLGFSSHAPVSFNTKWTMKPERLQEYTAAVETLRRTVVGLEIYKGLEVDYIPAVTSPNLFKDMLDYTIGSIHFVEKFPDGTRWEIDGTHTFFLEGFAKIFSNNIKDAIRRYFELTREMITVACPTIIGHMDKIKIQNVDGKFFSEADSWYQDEVKETINLIHSSGAVVEVNTRGIYQKKSATTYPSPWILEILHRKKIPITISSDAHHRDDLINQFPETAGLLKKIGFTSVSVLVDGKWQALPFNENGILR